MTPDARQKLRQLLVKHESYKPHPYYDSQGFLTIGIGRNLTTKGISETEAFYLLDDDIIYFSSKLSQLCPYFDALDDNRKIALIDMCFNLGVQGFLSFENLQKSLAEKDYKSAANHMLDSKWAMQVGQRAITLSNIISSGEIE